MQDKNKFFTLFVLTAITFVMIFAFSNLKINNNLNAVDNNNNQPVSNPFEFQSARSSLENNVAFENNFGGSLNDEITKVYNLDYYYIIGNTTSTDYYFHGNTVASVYVLKMSRSGSVAQINTSNSTAVTFVSSFANSFGIYILCKNNTTLGTMVFFYSFSSGSLTQLFAVDNVIPLEIVKTANELIVVGIKNSKINLVYFKEGENEDESQFDFQTTNFTGNNVKLLVAYQNGVLLFLNGSNSFNCYYITPSNYTLLYSNANNTLNSFTINENGYFLMLENEQTTVYVFLNFEFEKINQTLLAKNSTEHSLFLLNNNHYVFSKLTTGEINILLFSSSGDLVFNTHLNYNINNILKIVCLQNNFILALKTLENNLQLLTVNSMLQPVKDCFISFHISGTVFEMEQNYDSHFMLFGTLQTNTSVVKNNFGQKDVFVIKLLNV